MKEQIGEKIRRLRKEKRLTQENLHHNQSQVALIEKGTKKGGISNPTEDTLRIIAGNMDMTFESLIDETTWMKPESTLKSKEIAFSPVMVDVEIDDDGNISWSHKSYSLYNEKGEKAEYCLETGLKLIDSCENCGRQVENVKQEYCIGCGERLMESFNIPNSLREILGNRLAFDLYHECNNEISHIDQELNDVQNLLTAIEVGKKETSDKEIDPNAKWLLIKEVPPVGQLNNYKILITKCFSENKLVPDYVENQINFDIQLYEAARKKLISTAKNLQKPDDMEEMKINLFAELSVAVSEQLGLYPALYPALGQQSESEPKEKPSLQTLIQMMKDVEISQDTEELISRLQSKIDLNTKNREQMNKVLSKSEELMSTLQSKTNPQVKTEDDNDKEKISEDGNSETDAAENADRNNKNAENKKDKESKNE